MEFSSVPQSSCVHLGAAVAHEPTILLFRHAKHPACLIDFPRHTLFIVPGVKIATRDLETEVDESRVLAWQRKTDIKSKYEFWRIISIRPFLPTSSPAPHQSSASALHTQFIWKHRHVCFRSISEGRTKGANKLDRYDFKSEFWQIRLVKAAVKIVFSWSEHERTNQHPFWQEQEASRRHQLSPLAVKKSDWPIMSVTVQSASTMFLCHIFFLNGLFSRWISEIKPVHLWKVTENEIGIKVLTLSLVLIKIRLFMIVDLRRAVFIDSSSGIKRK